MKPWVIKLGGAALSNPEAAKNLAETIIVLKERGEQVVVVHGGGPMINKHLTEKNINWSFFEGQRITTKEMMSVITDALSEVNKSICEVFTSFGISTVGIHGPASELFFCRSMNKDLGLVGEVIQVNPALIIDVLNMGQVPVVAPIGFDYEERNYNLNADLGASALASALNANILIFATDQQGILDHNKLPYDSLTLAQLQVLMTKGGVTNGMLAKSRSIEKALLNGVKKVCVTHALELKDLIENRRGGTFCVESSLLDYVTKTKVKVGQYAVS